MGWWTNERAGAAGERGRVVAVGSAAGKQGLPRVAPYASFVLSGAALHVPPAQNKKTEPRTAPAQC